MTAEEIARAADLPRGSVYRYINALIENGLVERSGDGSEFKLGYRLLHFSSAVEIDSSLETVVLPYMERLRNETGETVSLTVLQGSTRAAAISSLEAYANVRVAPPIGDSIPLNAGANHKAILAFRPEDQWATVFAGELPRYTSNTITDPDALADELRRIRSQGYATSDQEIYEGAWGVAAPILDSSGHAIASLGVSGPTFRRSAEVQARSIELAVRYASEITERMALADHDQSRKKMFDRSRDP